jgi:hypothetical protein
LFHHSLESFNTVCNSFSFRPVISDSFIPATIEAAAWGCAEVRLLQGDKLYDSQKFDPDIAAYVGVLLDRQGLQKPPSTLTFATFPKMGGDYQNAEDVLLDDQESMRAWQDRQLQQKADLEKYILGRLKALVDQLDQIPLRSANADYVKRLVSWLSEHDIA